MNDKIIKLWEERKHYLEKYFKNTPQDKYGDYKDLVKLVFECVVNVGEKEYDVDRMTVIDDGDYQGTKLFIIPENTYQPNEEEYLITYVEYGSCSGCDTLEGIKDYDCYTIENWYKTIPDNEQVKDYMMLCLHLIQRMKKIYREEE